MTNIRVSLDQLRQPTEMTNEEKEMMEALQRRVGQAMVDETRESMDHKAQGGAE